MLSFARAISMLATLVATAPASAQVINGESTYGDSDLHQPPDEAASRPADRARDDDRSSAREKSEQR